MAQRQRGLGRGLGALIPSAQTENQDTTDSTNAASQDEGVSRETEPRGGGLQSEKAQKLEATADRVKTSGRSGSETSRRAEAAATPAVRGKAGKASGKARSAAKTPSAEAQEAASRDKKADAAQATTDAHDAKRKGAVQKSREGQAGKADQKNAGRSRKQDAANTSVSRETARRTKASRVDMGAALKASRTAGRATDVFFQTTHQEEKPSSAAQNDAAADPSRVAESTVSRETSRTGASAPEDTEQKTGRKKNTEKSTVDDSKIEASEGEAVSRETVPQTAPDSVQVQGSAELSAGSNEAVEAQTATPATANRGDEEVEGTDSTLVPVPGAHFGEIAVEDIHPNRKQPRHEFDEDEMEELIHSIREIGVLQPIVIRPSREEGDKKYELVMGERRWRATQRAGLKTVPAIVRETQDVDLLRDALLENLHRSQLNPLEEAAAYQQLLHEFGTTQDELAQRIGRSRPQISNTIRLLKLPALVQRRVAAGILSAGHARALLALSDPAAMERLAQRIVAEGLSVRSVEEIIQSGAAEKGKKTPRKATPATQHHERFDYIADAFADKLDTNVKINVGARKGKMTIEFASVDDLNRIISVLDPEIERH